MKNEKVFKNLISKHFEKTFRMGSYGVQGRRDSKIKNAGLVEIHTTGSNFLPKRNFFDKFNDQGFIDKNIKQIANAYKLQDGDNRDKLLLNGHTAIIRQSLEELDSPPLKNLTIKNKARTGSKTPSKLLQNKGKLMNSLIAIEIKE